MANTDIIKTKFYHSLKPKNLIKGLQKLIKNFLWYILDENSSCSHQDIVTNPYLLDSSWDFLYEWIIEKLIRVDHFKINNISNPRCQIDINTISNLNDSYCYFFHDAGKVSLIEHFIKHIRNGFAHGAFNDEDWGVLCDFNAKHYMGCFIKLNRTENTNTKINDSSFVRTLDNIFIEIINYKPIETLIKLVDIEIEVIENNRIILENHIGSQKYRTILIKDHPLTSSKERSIENIKEFVKSVDKEYLKSSSTDSKNVYVLPFNLNATFSNLNDAATDYIILTKHLFHEFLDNKMNPEIFNE